MDRLLEAMYRKQYKLVIDDSEEICEQCFGSGRHRICWGQSYCEERDTVTCPRCDGNGKHKKAASLLEHGFRSTDENDG